MGTTRLIRVISRFLVLGLAAATVMPAIPQREAVAGLETPVRSCNIDAIGQETAATSTRLRQMMLVGDWRLARHAAEQLVPLIGESIPAAAAATPESSGAPYLRDCVPDAMQLIAQFYKAMEVPEVAARAVELGFALHREGDIAARSYAALVAEIATFREVADREATLADSRKDSFSLKALPWRAIGREPHRYADFDADARDCDDDTVGRVRALLIGIAAMPAFDVRLEGPANDVRLIEASLFSRGVAAEDIVVLEDATATKRGILGAMETLAGSAQCGDFVLLYYTGGGTKLLDTVGWRGALAAGDDGTPVDAPDAFLWGADIAEFVTAVRNKRANILVAIDANEVDGLDIQHFQKLADRAANAGWDGRTIDGPELETNAVMGVSAAPLASMRGDYAVFYGAKVDQVVPDGVPFRAGNGEEKKYGVFSFAFASTLQSRPESTIADLAEGVATAMSRYATENDGKTYFGNQTPVFEASDPEMAVLGTASPQNLELEVLQPAGLRGGMNFASPTPSFKLIARLERPAQIGVLMVNNRPIAFAANGQFEATLDAKTGDNLITLSAVTTQQEFQTTAITFRYEGDASVLAATGTRYALVIGNQDYESDDAFPDLVTPVADAEAVATLLRDNYGFKTEMTPESGPAIPLFLTNATRSDILNTLSELERRLTEEDTLLIYYAGHGDLLRETDKAYWIPVDGKPADRFSWIDSANITESLKFMKARSVLLVVDSCYAGAMSRDPRELSYFDATSRKASLKKAAELKSRLFLSSGGKQPVNDRDQLISGHSPFAAAFIEGLRSMPGRLASSGATPDNMFVTRELFDDYIYHQVNGRYPQEPQFKQLENSGHLGGDFVFAQQRP